MTDSNERLAQDLAILNEMAGHIEAYLKSETLFWPMGYSDMPKLTLGGYWLRQHRLQSLHHLLTADQQAQFATVMKLFETAVTSWVVRTEQRAHTELEARLRQWSEYLRDVLAGKGTDIAGYPAHVETRAIIAALVHQMQERPYRLDESLLPKLIQLDKGLRARWADGDFVWPPEWQTAYPKPEFWWLYGRPQK